MYGGFASGRAELVCDAQGQLRWPAILAASTTFPFTCRVFRDGSSAAGRVRVNHHFSVLSAECEPSAQFGKIGPIIEKRFLTA